MTPLSKRLVIALAISGALNLLAIGLFVGGSIKRSRHPDGRERVERRDGDRDRERNRDRQGSRKRSLGPSSKEPELAARRMATADARKVVREALERKPFEPAALERALAALRTETAATQEVLHKGMLQAATKGDQKEREDIARGFGRLGAGP